MFGFKNECNIVTGGLTYANVVILMSTFQMKSRAVALPVATHSPSSGWWADSLLSVCLCGLVGRV